MTAKKNYVPRFHLMPPTGWLNDPNGLCQLKGMHHIFFQYSPAAPRGGKKYWGHYETRDFFHYRFTDIFLKPDSRADRDGVYSGCAYVEDDTMYIYYTGNVKKEGDYDYICNGREGNTILVTSRNGRNASKKEWLLKNEDYPKTLSNHVRDPKVFFENGSYYMVLGARTKDDKGCVVLYISKDKRVWQFDHFIQKDGFGYMWECPDLFRIGGEQYLSLSPQGLMAEEYRYQNIYQSGYFHASEDLIRSGDGLGDFTEWDYGFDFYAPQTYKDEKGRRILIGWMGVPDAPYDHDPSIDEGWQHMLTIPRELSVDIRSKRICQNPIQEMKALREDVLFDGNSKEMPEVIKMKQGYEILLSKFSEDAFEVSINEGFLIVYDNTEKILRFLFTDEQLGYGRTERKLKLFSDEQISDMRIYVDTCCVEIYINHGIYVFTTKYFKNPNRDNLLSVKGNIMEIKIYQLSGFEIT